ncbi:MAG: AAA family ATPase [Neisseriaceae bacterium]
MNSNNHIRFIFKNIGQIVDAEISLNQMTVIAGKNSVSKTYITYLIFGFLDYIKSISVNETWQQLISKQLLNSTRKTEIDMAKLAKDLPKFIEKVAKDYSKIAYQLLSFEPDSESLKNFSFNVIIDNLNIDYTKPLLTQDIEIAQNIKIELNLSNQKGKIYIYPIIQNHAEINEHMYSIMSSYIVSAIMNYFFSQLFPLPFIVTSERTGVSIFYRELDTARSALIDTLQQNSSLLGKASDSLMKKHIARYPLPIKLNMDFIRNIFDISKNKSNLKPSLKSFISKQISNGRYTFDKHLNQIFFIPKSDLKLKLPIHSSSSSVKSLLLFDAYINFVADQNQILIIDEPELNLHPDNQRKMARFLAMLANSGVKVLFTTHSDYIVKELNNLIMLYEIGAHNQSSIITHFNKTYQSAYSNDMPIPPKEVDCYTIVENDKGFHAHKTEIDRYGVNLSILDDEINNLSEISQILYNELDNDYYQ